MKKNIYCTLDTETVGGCTAPTGMYNLGAVIHDGSSVSRFCAFSVPLAMCNNGIW